MNATRALVGRGESPADLGSLLLDAITAPWSDDSVFASLEDRCQVEVSDPPWDEAFRARGGHARAQDYEATLRQRFEKRGMTYATSMSGYGDLRPDATVAPYAPCALSNAPDSHEDSLRDAMRRRCHVVEFTSHLRGDLEGIDAYLLDKVLRYATMLEEL
jgi:hypothetical protein